MYAYETRTISMILPLRIPDVSEDSFQRGLTPADVAYICVCTGWPTHKRSLSSVGNSAIR